MQLKITAYPQGTLHKDLLSKIVRLGNALKLMELEGLNQKSHSHYMTKCWHYSFCNVPYMYV